MDEDRLRCQGLYMVELVIMGTASLEVGVLPVVEVLRIVSSDSRGKDPTPPSPHLGGRPRTTSPCQARSRLYVPLTSATCARSHSMGPPSPDLTMTEGLMRRKSPCSSLNTFLMMNPDQRRLSWPACQ